MIIFDSKYTYFMAEQDDLTNIWECFINNEKMDQYLLPSPIISSWRRSSELKVDPLMRVLDLSAAPDFQERLSSKKQLLDVAIPYITKFYKIVEQSDFVLSIFDEKGLLLEIIGDEDRVKRLKSEYNIYPGVTCCEQTMGTTATYLSIYSNLAVQTVGAEHFIQRYHHLTDSAAPIHDLSGKVIGGISMSAQNIEFAHPHTLGMVTSMALAIENLLCLKEENKNHGLIEYRRKLTKQDEAMQTTKRAAATWKRSELEGKEANKPVPNVENMFGNIIGNSHKLMDAIRLAKKAANAASTVLLLGETGTGKELFAQAIHDASMMREGPFISVNCAAIPKDLVGAELFGYEGGAFTGAKREGNAGKFEMADGGTIFLDEIGEMPLEMQTVLLRVLEEKKITRIGGNASIPVNIRIIAATNRKLREDALAGRFRLDLFFRLNVFSIDLPPLRERKEDIPVLVNYLISLLARSADKNIDGIEPEAMEVLCQYDWPGNIRELSNCIERAVNCADSGLVGVQDLPKEVLLNVVETGKEEILTVRNYEKEKILELIAHFKGNKSKTALKLGISRATLYRRLQKFGIL